MQHAVIDIDSGTTAQSPETSGGVAAATATAAVTIGAAAARRGIVGGPSYSQGSITPFAPQPDASSPQGGSPQGHSPGARGRNVHWKDESPFTAAAAEEDPYADSPFESALLRGAKAGHEAGQAQDDSPFEAALQDGSPFEMASTNGCRGCHDGAWKLFDLKA